MNFCCPGVPESIPGGKPGIGAEEVRDICHQAALAPHASIDAAEREEKSLTKSRGEAGDGLAVIFSLVAGVPWS